MSKNTRRLYALALTSWLGLSGCSSMLAVADREEFSCPGMPSGVVCKTPMAVYQMTHGASTAPGPDKGRVPNAGGAGPGQMPHAIQQPALLQPITGAPTPLREPSRVMRIWIGPWVESKTDNLHWPTYVYVEVQPRKWTIGDPDFRSMRPSMPLTARPSIAQTPVQAPSSAGGATQGSEAPAAVPSPRQADPNGEPQPYD